MQDPTFIGPVLRERKPDPDKPGHFTVAYVCTLVQGGSTVALAAPSRVEAVALRIEHIKAGAEPVPTLRLLLAIADALKWASEPKAAGRRAA